MQLIKTSPLLHDSSQGFSTLRYKTYLYLQGRNFLQLSKQGFKTCKQRLWDIFATVSHTAEYIFVPSAAQLSCWLVSCTMLLVSCTILFLQEFVLHSVCCSCTYLDSNLRPLDFFFLTIEQTFVASFCFHTSNVSHC